MSAPLPRLARPIWAIAAAKVAFHLATSRLYGFHRDEFYYLAGGRRLAWGYVDHPPMTPFLFRVEEVLFGDGRTGLRVIPAIVGGVLVVLGALLARELGGGRWAQLTTGAVAALGPLFLPTSHFLGTVTMELVAWAVASLLLLRLVRSGDRRLWLAIGVTVGLGMLDKYTMALWVIGAGVGLLCTPERRVLRTPWVLAGAAVAVLVVLPNLLWQASHHWAFLEFSRNLAERTGGESRAQFVPLQLGIVTVGGTVLWAVALRRGFRRDAPWRWLAIAYPVLAVLLLVAGGKSYYLGPLYLPLVAAGAVVVEASWTAAARRAVVAAVVVTGVLIAPVFTPILPELALEHVALQKVNPDLGAFLGWHRLAEQVAAVADGLPPADRRHAVILAASYSQAGALEYWRDDLHLPRAISGHNTDWWWGHAAATDGGTTIVVGYDRAFLDRFFGSVELATTIHDGGHPMDEEADGRPVWICRDQRRPWSSLWPELRHYD